MQFLCLRCRAQREVEELVPGVLGSKRFVLRGKCPVCGSVVSKLVSQEVYARYLGKVRGEATESERAGGEARAIQEAADPPEGLSTGSETAEAPEAQPAQDWKTARRWRGVCQRCGVERELEGEYFGTTWQGETVARVTCPVCGWPQKVRNAIPIL